MSTAQGALVQAGLSDEAEYVEDAGVQFEDTGMPPLLFMARRADLRLTKQARYPIAGVGGAKTGETKGQSISFRDHMLVVPREGEMLVTDTLGAGEWTASADEIADYLRSHRLLGDMFEGFWEVDPVAPQPSEDELDALQDAALRLDEDGLVAIIRREEKGWGRDLVLRTARKTLSKVREVRAEVEAKAAAATEAAAQADTPKDAAPPETPAEPATEPQPADTATDTPAAMQAPGQAAEADAGTFDGQTGEAGHPDLAGEPGTE